MAPSCLRSSTNMVPTLKQLALQQLTISFTGCRVLGMRILALTSLQRRSWKPRLENVSVQRSLEVRVLLRGANLTEQQRENLAIRYNALLTFDQIARALRPLDRPEALVLRRWPQRGDLAISRTSGHPRARVVIVHLCSCHWISHGSSCSALQSNVRSMHVFQI